MSFCLKSNLKYVFFQVCLFIFFTSCSFNKLFLHPVTIEQSTEKTLASARKNGDSIWIYFNGINKQPTLVSGKLKDTLKLDFTIESIFLKSKNGNRLNGWWLRPKNNSNGITLLHCHGNAGNLITQLNAIAPLTRSGFQIFMFDYSGFGFSGGRACKKNILSDGISALEYVTSHNYTHEHQLAIYGQSLGGNLAGVLAGRNEKSVDGLIMEGAFSSHKGIAYDFIRNIFPAGFLGWIFTKKDYNSKKEIRKFHKPVLVIHSKEDKVVPFRHGKILFENAHTPKELFEIENCHICGPYYYEKEISEKIKRMLKRN